jgi:N-acyl homoserine lactone hydrolase
VSNIRLHMFSCGTLRCHVHDMKANEGLGQPHEIPVPWFHITHPRGNVIIDGGNAPQVAVDAHAHWGIAADYYVPVMAREDACVPAMKEAGLDPLDVRWILQSHLHLDHSGALGAIEQFPNAKVIATRTEYEYAHAPDWFSASGYCARDFTKPNIDWALLEYLDDGYDLFGDGVIRMWRTPGHSPGHQSFELSLPETGAVLLTVDAANTLDHWNERSLPGMTTSALEAVRSVHKLRRIAARTNPMIVVGHDPDAWSEFRVAPDFYE